MHAADILALLSKAGHPPAKIARTLGVYPSAVSSVIHNKGASFRIAQHIGKITGVSIHTLWPGRYENPCKRGRPYAA